MIAKTPMRCPNCWNTMSADAYNRVGDGKELVRCPHPGCKNSFGEFVPVGSLYEATILEGWRDKRHTQVGDTEWQCCGSTMVSVHLESCPKYAQSQP